MENNIVRPGGGFFKQLFVVLLMIISIYLSEGVMGFAPFINIEAILLVFGGTFLLTWTAFPLREIFSTSRPAILRHAADCAIGMGILAMLLHAATMLWTGDPTPGIIKHLAPALAGPFYGFLLAKGILGPIAARHEENEKNKNLGTGL